MYRTLTNLFRQATGGPTSHRTVERGIRRPGSSRQSRPAAQATSATKCSHNAWRTPTSPTFALSRRDLNISHAKLRVMIVDNDDFFLHHPPELLSHVQDADACIYCLGTNVPVRPAELNRKINFEFAISTARRFSAEKSRSTGSRPFKFVYLSGALPEKDETKKLWFLADNRRMRGQLENELLRLDAETRPGGLFEVYIARPGFVQPQGAWLRTWVVGKLANSIMMHHLAASMLQVALEGHSGPIVENEELNGIGRRVYTVGVTKKFRVVPESSKIPDIRAIHEHRSQRSHYIQVMSRPSPLNDPVPSYEESIASGWTPATLHQQLDDARLSRVRDVLSTYIDPLLASQSASGIYKTVFLLVPCNVTSLPPLESSSYSQPEIVGFASTEVVKLVRLKGEEHTVEFWRQPFVLDELAASLRMRLAMSGHRVAGESTNPPPVVVEPAHSGSRKWFRSSKTKKAKSSLWAATAPSEATIIDRKLGWRSDTSNSVSTGEVRVHVEWTEICLRVENAVGLYETQKGAGVRILCVFCSLPVDNIPYMLQYDSTYCVYHAWCMGHPTKNITTSLLFSCKTKKKEKEEEKRETKQKNFLLSIYCLFIIQTNMPPASPLAIATSSVQRLVKEEASYHRELEQQTKRLQKLESETPADDNEGNREFLLKQERQAIEETKAVFPTLKQKITDALAKLEQLIVEEGHKGEASNVEQLTAAKEAVSQGKTSLREIA
ncbi:hypothetical protein UA08_03681 [Talaromyces atroroseus]|uniref:Uncharacterized protein n=1 Tax=Talaromyces atroroseus TaxID=1441469 RepID=A0A225B691_TALAT|nr:hypothetical protein UA08_03681 [Talaromyces atroroseus]OKL61417.1 hypothetical protein UA08_03681 [Talaromyces atroroseus]